MSLKKKEARCKLDVVNKMFSLQASINHIFVSEKCRVLYSGLFLELRAASVSQTQQWTGAIHLSSLNLKFLSPATLGCKSPLCAGRLDFEIFNFVLPNERRMPKQSSN